MLIVILSIMCLKFHPCGQLLPVIPIIYGSLHPIDLLFLKIISASLIFKIVINSILVLSHPNPLSLRFISPRVLILEQIAIRYF